MVEHDLWMYSRAVVNAHGAMQLSDVQIVSGIQLRPHRLQNLMYQGRDNTPTNHKLPSLVSCW